MLSPALDRLIWKETRTLAALWLTLLGLLALLLSLAPLIDSAFPSQMTERAATIALVLTACVAVAGAAVMFAGETEDGTADLLRQLPIRTRDLLASKFGVLGLATATFLLAGLLAAVGCRRLAGEAATLASLQAPEVYGQAVLGCLAWGLLCSLRQDRVLAALGWGVVLEVLTIGLIGNVLTDYDRERRWPLHAGIVAAVLAVDVWLALSWARTGATLRRPGLTATSRPTARTLWESCQDRVAGAWLGALRWFAGVGSPPARSIGVLCWREARTALPVFAGWLVLGGLVVAAMHSSYREPLRVAPLIWLLATPLLCGLMLGHGERRGSKTSFLAEHGVTPRGLWLLRQFVWSAPALLLCLTTTSAVRLPQGASTDMRWLFELAGLAPWRVRNLDEALLETSWETSFALHLGFLATLLAAGQVCGLWFRSSLVGGLVSLAIGTAVVLWRGVVDFLDVPPATTLWPLAALWLLATWRQMPAWLAGERSRGILIERSAWLAAPPLLVAAMLCVERRQQVPEVARSYAVRDPFPSGSLAAAELTRDFLAVADLLPPEWKATAKHAAAATADGAAESPPPRQQGQQEALDAYAAAIENFSPDVPFTLERLAPARELLTRLQGAWRPFRDRGELDAEFAVHLAALRLTRHEQSLTWHPWPLTIALRRRRDACQRIAAWANDERQTTERLERAIPLLRAEFNHDVDVQSMAQNWERELLEAIAAGRTSPRQHYPPVDNEGLLTRGLLALLGEPDRQARLVRLIAAAAPALVNGRDWGTFRHEILWPVARFSRRSDVELPPIEGSETPTSRLRHFDVSEVETWHAARQANAERPAVFEVSAFGRVAPMLQGATHQFRELRSDIERLRMAEGAALLITALQAHRLRHGTFPDDPWDLLQQGRLTQLPQLEYHALHGLPFEFHPTGVAVPHLLSSQELIPAGQPLLVAPPPDDVQDAPRVPRRGQLSADNVTEAERYDRNVDLERVATGLSTAYRTRHPHRILFVGPAQHPYSLTAWFAASPRHLRDGAYVDEPGQ